jgi:hypothetical protein
LYRDGDVVVTGWSEARIRWPLCRRLGGHGGGLPSLLVDEALARAIRCESVAAICHWWGASMSLVCRWRRAMAVSRTSNPGTHRLMRGNVEVIAASRRGKEWTDEERSRRHQRAVDSESVLPWSEEELALLGTMPD